MAIDVRAEAAHELRGKIRGDVFVPGNEGYESTRTLWNGATDVRPALVAKVADPVDVAVALDFARERELPIGVRGGGHGVHGKALVSDGLVIDTRAMNRTVIDPVARTIWVEAGATMDEVNIAAQRFGLAIPGGKNATPGVAGVALGGGIGFLVRKHGLAIDSVRSVELVTADGAIVTANAEINSELFWGLRGGGGNFGVVTGLSFDLHEVGMIRGGLIAFSFDQARDVLHGYADLAPTLPETVTTVAILMSVPGAGKAIGIGLAHAGDAAEGERVLDQVRALGAPMLDQLGVMPYDVLPRVVDQSTPGGFGRSWRSGYCRALAAPVLDTLVHAFAEVPSPTSAVLIEQLGGAMGRVPAQATAYAHRDATNGIAIDAAWANPTEREAAIAWSEALWRSIAPATRGVYVNFMGDEPGRIRDAYPGATYDRLAALKRAYDPENRFQGNQNVVPAGA